MKLIDRDKFISDMFDLYIEQKWKPSDIHFSLLDVRSNIDFKGYEVKAIPIEWILNYRKNNQGEITYYTIDAIDHMLSEWCKLSSIDMWDMINGWEKENDKSNGDNTRI